MNIPSGWKIASYELCVGDALYRAENFGSGTWFVTLFPLHGKGCYTNETLDGGYDTAEAAMAAAEAHSRRPIAAASYGPQDIDADGRPVETP